MNKQAVDDYYLLRLWGSQAAVQPSARRNGKVASRSHKSSLRASLIKTLPPDCWEFRPPNPRWGETEIVRDSTLNWGGASTDALGYLFV